MTPRGAKTIRVDTLARVEGEGSLYIKLVGERVADVKLKIYEPPRLFEAFLRGRHFSEAGRHHRANLWHLSRRLPDECGARDGACFGCAHRSGGPASSLPLLLW
jgi:hypothetical protein